MLEAPAKSQSKLLIFYESNYFINFIEILDSLKNETYLVVAIDMFRCLKASLTKLRSWNFFAVLARFSLAARVLIMIRCMIWYYDMMAL